MARLDRWDASRLSVTALHPRLNQPMRVVDMAFFTAEHDDHHLARMTELSRPQAGRPRVEAAQDSRISADGLGYFLTSNSWAPAGLPSTEISTLYLPAGQPLALETWNSVAAGPVGAMVCSDSLTSCPASP